VELACDAPPFLLLGGHGALQQQRPPLVALERPAQPLERQREPADLVFAGRRNRGRELPPREPLGGGGHGQHGLPDAPRGGHGDEHGKGQQQHRAPDEDPSQREHGRQRVGARLRDAQAPQAVGDGRRGDASRSASASPARAAGPPSAARRLEAIARPCSSSSSTRYGSSA
jgi:hypothetical protein